MSRELAIRLALIVSTLSLIAWWCIAVVLLVLNFRAFGAFVGGSLLVWILMLALNRLVPREDFNG